jgi:DNA-binding transcriptional MerR regulator
MDKQGQIAFDFFGTSMEEDSSVDTSKQVNQKTSLQPLPSITPERKLVPPAQVEIKEEVISKPVFIPEEEKEIQPDTKFEPKTEIQPETEIQSETEIEPDAEIQPEIQFKPETNPNSPAKRETNSEPGSEIPDNKLVSHPKQPAEKVSESTFRPEIEIIASDPSDDVIDFNVIKFEVEEITTPDLPSSKSTRGRKSIKSYDKDADLPEIPANESDFTKQYYSIGEVALMFKVNASLLRFWETEFDIIQPRKNKKGDRHFRPVDIKNLELIYDLLRRRKLTIEGAKEYLKSNKRSREKYEMIRSLENLKSFLLEIKANL